MSQLFLSFVKKFFNYNQIYSNNHKFVSTRTQKYKCRKSLYVLFDLIVFRCLSFSNPQYLKSCFYLFFFNNMATNREISLSNYLLSVTTNVFLKVTSAAHKCLHFVSSRPLNTAETLSNSMDQIIRFGTQGNWEIVAWKILNVSAVFVCMIVLSHCVGGEGWWLQNLRWV